MTNEDFIKFLHYYGNMNKFDLITEIIKRYDDKSYFAQRKVWIKKTFGELLVTLYEFKTADLVKEIHSGR